MRRRRPQFNQHSKSKGQEQELPLPIDDLKSKLTSYLQDSPDLTFKQLTIQTKKIVIFYISYQIKQQELDSQLLTPLLYTDKQWDTNTILNDIPIGNGKLNQKLGDIATSLITGGIGVYIENEQNAVMFQLPQKESRQIEKAEIESLVLGPQVAFTESLDKNMNLVRWRFDSHDLVTEKFIIGERINSEVRMVYLKSLANDTDVQTMRQRLKDLVIDDVEDSSRLSQYISDDGLSVFPQFYNTELVNRFCYSVGKGRVGVLVDRSPTGLIAPASLFSFFESTEDNFLRWNIGTFIRVLRFFAMVFSVIVTPAYVAVLTFHYEVIPTNLLVQLGQSRAEVPFPPVIEALLLELLLELLREAGARLPTKVGQTMAIVGGIVLGQAAVDAGLTSNVLIIVVASSALSAFTAPNYLMGSAIRILRFPLLLIASTLGLIGLIAALSFITIHLIKLTSLGRPYILPVYPIEKQDINKALYTSPAATGNKRSVSYLLKDIYKYPKERSMKKKDIDE